jgi:hypothetical protein
MAAILQGRLDRAPRGPERCAGDRMLKVCKVGVQRTGDPA